MPKQVMGASLLVAGAVTGNPGLALAGASMVFSPSPKRPSLPQTQTGPRGGLQVNTSCSRNPIALAYGTMRFGINRCYIHSTGTNRDRMHIVAILGEGPFPTDAIQNIYLGDKPIADYGANAGYYFHRGTADQTHDTVLAGYDARWADAMRNTAYLYIWLLYDQDKFGSFPNNITVQTKCREIYDMRTGTTAWSDNRALVAWDICANEYAGMEMPSAYLDSDSFGTAATWCEINGYTFNGILYERQAGVDLLDQVLEGCRAKRIWSEDKLKIKILDYDSPVMTLTDDDVVPGSEKATGPHTKDRYNAAAITFHNAAKAYIEEPLIISDADAIAADGQMKQLEMKLLGATDYAQVQKIGAYKIDRSRLDTQYYNIFRPRVKPLECIDLVTCTLDAFGWSGQVARVMAVQPMPNYLVGLLLEKETASLYDDSVNTATHNTYETTLPDPLAVPPSVINVSWDEETYIQGDNTYSRIRIAFDPPADYPFFDYAEVYISWDDGVTYKFLGKNSTGFTVETLREGNNFLLKFLSVSTMGVKQALGSVSATGVTISGVATAPANVGGFQVIPVGDNVNLRWSAVDATDLRYYELRYGTAWGTSLLICQTKSQSWAIPSIRPGEHTFLLKAQNTAGIYSETAGIDTRTMYAPNGYSESSGSPYNEDYDSGTHYNTEYVDDGTYGRLLRVKPDSLANGDMESWASATDLNDWTEVLAGASTVNREAVTIHGDTYSCRLDIDASNSEAGIHQSRHLRDAADSLLSFYHQESAADKTMKYSIYSDTDVAYLQSDGTWDAAEYWFAVANSNGAWTLVEKIFTTGSAGDYRVYFRNDSAASASIYIDDVTLWSEKGKYIGITFDLGAVVIRRLWLSELLIHYYGSGTTWDTFFTPSDTWESAVPATATWISLLSGVTCGDLRIVFQYSEDDISYSDVDNFQIYQTQVQLRYFKAEFYIENVSPENYIAVEDVNTRVYQAA